MRSHQRIYVCHTFYHAYIACLKELDRPAEERGEATLLLSSMSNDFGTLQERAAESGLFELVLPFDEKEEKILNEFGDWMNINKEAILDTRPWEIFGEGPIAEADIKINAQGFNEGSYSKATAQEIRFTQTKKDLYATVLAWPTEKQILIKSLSDESKLFPGKISRVELLGYGKVPFTRTDKGLLINMPDKQINKIAPVFKIKK